MSAPPGKPVGPWAREKLESLRAYLEYYTKVMKNQSWCETWYIDAFAGPGLSPVRTQSLSQEAKLATLFPNDLDISDGPQFVKGSPRVALELANPFKHYIFIDKAPGRIAELQALQAEFGTTRDIQVFPGDANERLSAFLAQHLDWRRKRGVVFLDPFGMELPWSTIAALGQTRGLEVIVNFPWGTCINRLLTKSGQIDQTWQAKLTSTFGSEHWHELTYSSRETLLGQNEWFKRTDTTGRILEWFTQRLRDAFGHASAAQLIRNTKGNPLYYLIWAGPHQKGLVGANYILGRRHHLGGEAFTRPDAAPPTLFSR